jgi:hypothetical protein
MILWKIFMEYLRRGWTNIGYKWFDLEYIVYGNTLYETETIKKDDGIHTIEKFKENSINNGK